MNELIDQVIQSLRALKQHFAIEDEGEVGDLVGVKIDQAINVTITLTQPQLIDSILEDLHMKDTTKPRSVPACSSKLLHKDANGEVIEPDFHYQSIIGKLNSQYLHEHLSMCSFSRQF